MAKFIIKKEKLKLNTVVDWILVMSIFGVITLICNYVGYGNSIVSAIPGILVLLVLTLLGLILEKIIPLNLPAIVYISLLALIVALPISPISNFVVESTNKISTLAICTVILSYSGVAIGKSWKEFCKMGWRGILVTIFVIFSTFLGSALVAQIILKMQGII